MNLPFTAAAPADNQPARDAPATRLRGQRLVFARAGWLLAALPAAVIYIFALPSLYIQLQSACATPTCATQQLNAAELRATLAAGWSPSFFATAIVTLSIAHAVLWCAAGLIIFWRRSDDWMALFVALFLILFGTNFATFALDQPIVAALQAFLADLAWVALYAFLCLFPNGRFVPRWMWVPLAITIVFQIPESLPPDSPYAVNNWPPAIVLPVLGAQFGCALYAQVYRYRRASNAVERQQTKWVVFGIGTGLTVYMGANLLFALVPELFSPPALHYVVLASILTLALLFIPASLAMAILRSRLWEVDVLLNRTLLYGALTASVIGIYVLVVGYLGALFRAQGSLPISLVATGLVAVLFQPLRERFQRGINRLLYGERDQPYAVIARLGQRLEAALAPDAVLPALVESVAQALKLPYVAVMLAHGDEFALAAEYPGAEARRQADARQDTEIAPALAPDRLVALPLAYQGKTVGKLMLMPRAPGEGFSPADRHLLAVLTQQAGVAAHTVRLTTDLQRLAADLQESREHLISAREEERRRLRRDLHDGIGPNLASMAQRIDASTYIIRDDPDEAIALLQGLKRMVRDTLADIRRLVYALRPPALDELGLVGAVREHAAQFARSGNLAVVVEAPQALPALPAAVELAAYRIALEALTNVARHARASHCDIQFVIAEADGRPVLNVRIHDDGVGLPAERHKGVGLTSMGERASELGGTYTVELASGGGTSVYASLPLE